MKQVRMNGQDLCTVKAVFAGNVQGVGFRYTAQKLSNGFKITGYVRNMPDGTVELKAQGEKGEISGFLKSLKERMSQHIARADVITTTESLDCTGFEIRH